MKALPFTIPKTGNASFFIQKETLDAFYPYLHKHEEVQICWIKKGRGTLIVQTEIYNFKDQDVFIIASNRAHLFKNESKEKIETVSLFFNLNPAVNPLMMVPEMLECREYLLRISSCSILPKDSVPIFEKILKTNRLDGIASFIQLLKSLLHAIPLESKMTIDHSDRAEDKMRLIMEYTMENLHRDIDIKQVANHTNYTPEAFCRFFRKRTGKTYISYLNDLRITAACQQIINQETSDIRRVAFDCGYNSVSHFNRVFKKYRNCSPLQYRKAYFMKEKIVI